MFKNNLVSLVSRSVTSRLEQLNYCGNVIVKNISFIKLIGSYCWIFPVQIINYYYTIIMWLLLNIIIIEAANFIIDCLFLHIITLLFL